jgi:hypothetical protein
MTLGLQWVIRLASPPDSPPRIRRAQSQTGPLKQILRTHLRTFLDRSQGSDTPRSLPAHITRELHAFVRCGDPTFGFARLRCPSCLFDQLIPFSCKGRGFCPSCAGRRMAAIAAHLTDHVLPDQPLRQWVLSLPWSLRIHLACNPALTRDVGRAFLRAVFASYTRRARLAGQLLPRTTTSPLSHPPKAHPGAINFTQRFGSSLALNIHFHALVLDGVYTTDGPDSIPVFHPAHPLTQDEVQRVRQSIHRRINRVLNAHGLLPSPGSDPSPPADEHDSLLPFLQAASIQSRVALGPDSGRPIPKLADHADVTTGPHSLPPLTSNEQGYSLHAATHIPANDRALRERLCRYISRPPLAQGRLSLTDEGGVLWKLRSPWRDGTKAFLFDPLVFIERLVAILPHPREHQLTYHGVFAPASSLRHLVVPRPAATDPEHAHCHKSPTATDPPETATKLHTGSSTYRWPELLKRVFNEDVLRCPNCHGHRTLLTAITDPFAIRQVSLGPA